MSFLPAMSDLAKISMSTPDLAAVSAMTRFH